MLLVAALLLLLAGCASVTPPPEAAISPAIPDEIPRQPGEAIIIEPEPSPIMSGNKAVIALLDRARLDSDAGRHDAAGAALERGLRIEPRNPWLWNELAQLRLAQGQYAQAIALARKSNSFAGGERRLQAVNWRVIGNARVAQGDSAGAEEAFKLAAEREQTAPAEQPGIELFGAP